jgi:hypothetical protein
MLPQVLDSPSSEAGSLAVRRPACRHCSSRAFRPRLSRAIPSSRSSHQLMRSLTLRCRIICRAFCWASAQREYIKARNSCPEASPCIKKSMKIRDYHLFGPFRQWRARSGRCLLANLSRIACCRHFHHARQMARIRDCSADVGNRSRFSTKRIHQSSK